MPRSKQAESKVFSFRLRFDSMAGPDERRAYAILQTIVDAEGDIRDRIVSALINTDPVYVPPVASQRQIILTTEEAFELLMGRMELAIRSMTPANYEVQANSEEWSYVQQDNVASGVANDLLGELSEDELSLLENA